MNVDFLLFCAFPGIISDKLINPDEERQVRAVTCGLDGRHTATSAAPLGPPHRSYDTNQMSIGVLENVLEWVSRADGPRKV